MGEYCGTFRRQAGRTSRYLAGSLKLQVGFSEETVTELLIYEVASKHGASIHVEPATKYAESRHGADWEWWFLDDNWELRVRVQAKRMYPSNGYDALSLDSGQNAQLSKLIAKAAASSCTPIACFYNRAIALFMAHKHRCRHRYFGRSYWGCSYALAEDVQAANSQDPALLLPFTRPLHELVCRSPDESLTDAVKRSLDRPRDGDGTVPREAARSSIRSPSGRMYLEEVQRAADRRADSLLPEFSEHIRPFLVERELAGLVIFDGTSDR